MTSSSPSRPFTNKLPSCGPLTSRKSSRIEISKRFTRSELEDAVRRKKRDDVAYNNHRATDHRATNHNATEHLDSTSQQIRSLDLGVKLCARKYNEAKAQRLRIEEQVNIRNDELAELERESKALSEMLQGSNPEARKIATLTDEIQHVVGSSSDLLTYRQQLKHMHLRLQNNSVALDAHLGEMADTVKVAQKEKNRSQKMLAELESGLTLASIQLDDTIQEISILDEQRNHELSLKRAEANDADRRDMKNRTRVSSNLAMHASLADTSRSEREQLQRTLREHQLQMKDMRIKSIKVTAKLTSYEESFAHVKQATGVNSLTEMCQKMKHHAQQHRNLSSELSCAEERLKAARASLVKDKETLAQLKTNGLCTTELNREILDELKSSVKSEKADGKIVSSTNKRLEDLLVGLRQGGIGLYNRLLPFHSTFLAGEAPKLGVMDSTNAIQAASDTMEMISFTEKILANMIKVLGGIQFVDTKHVTAEGGGGDSPGEKINLRVTPKKPEPELEASNDDDSTVDDGTPPTRDQLKQAHLAAEAQRIETEIKTSRSKSKRVKAKVSSPPSAGSPIVKQSPPTPQPSSTPKLLSPPKSNQRVREDPMDRVTAFLTEMPFLE